LETRPSPPVQFARSIRHSASPDREDIVTRTAADIRREFIEFFQQRGHTHVPGAPVIPHDDPTLLFTNAGMNQFKPLFLGAADRDSDFGRLRRAVNSQPCIRAGGKHNDLDDVGHDTYHHTFFEMLGNWSFGDYFKKEAIEWAWELVTNVWGLDPSRLHATYFEGTKARGPEGTAGNAWELEPDYEARDIWLSMPGVSPERVHPGSMKDNFWEMGETGPCGPCSEIHIDLTPDKSGGALVNAGDERVIEFWNLVFIQFNRGPDGKLTPLPARHVDTGMGFERIVRLIQGRKSNYDTDVFAPIFEAIRRVSGAAPYGGRLENESEHGGADAQRGAVMRDVAYRVIADHIRTLTFAMSDGCLPDKDGRGFVLRRILRRAVRYGWQYLGLREPFLCKLVPTVVGVMRDAFPQLEGGFGVQGSGFRNEPRRIAEIIREEEESFERTLERGIALFDEAAERAARDHHREIRGEQAFKLHDTYGFPIDLTEIMARERGLRVDIGEYERLMEDARERARGSRVVSRQWLEDRLVAANVRTRFVGCETLRVDGAVVQFVLRSDGTESIAGLQAGERGYILLDKTPFYPEQGGQIGDRGVIRDVGGQWEFEVEDTKRIQDAHAHIGVCVRGRVQASQIGGGAGSPAEGGPLPTAKLAIGGNAAAEVDRNARGPTMQNHTATHLLNWALRDVLDPRGQQLQQRGSLVDPHKTRFDFSHGKALTPDELRRIESLVAQKIRENLPVHAEEIDKSAGDVLIRKAGLRAVFGEKYPDRVRIVSIGLPVSTALENPEDPKWWQYSLEYCGGTHVRSTAEIEHFVLTSEEAVARGVRRVVGVSGQRAKIIKELGAALLLEAAALRQARGAALELGVAKLAKAAAEAEIPVGDRMRLHDLLAELQQLVRQQQRETTAASADVMQTRVDELLARATKRGATTIVVADMGQTPIDQLKLAADMIKQRAGSAAICFGVHEDATSGKVMLLAALTDDLVKKGIKAGDWIKAIAPIVDGSGGGPPTMAQAGGKNPARLGEALTASGEWIRSKIA
jgi:alanyl-tRNA synthetase